MMSTHLAYHDGHSETPRCMMTLLLWGRRLLCVSEFAVVCPQSCHKAGVVH